MSSLTAATDATVVDSAQEVIISADSHVVEPNELWVERLPPAFRERAPRFPARSKEAGFAYHPGGHDPYARIEEMRVDGVSAEVLYPSLGMRLFALDDAALQEACFRVYNDWLIEYCQAAPDRLVGIPLIATYDVDHAIHELERCRKAGLKGAMIWQAPHPDLPLRSDHYERFWAAAQALDAPVNLHIRTGHNYTKVESKWQGPERYRGGVTLKLRDALDGLFDLIFYGVAERYPRLRFVIVENEIGWLPFYLQEGDRYYRRFRQSVPLPIDKLPSEYFYRQFYATFFDDPAGAHFFTRWPVDNYMWSSDFPHPDSPWPHSRQVIERDLGHLPADVRAKLVRENVARLYDLAVPAPL